MIADRISNAGLYEGLGPDFRGAFDFLRSAELPSLEPGTRELDGRRLFVILQDYLTKPEGEGLWEAHRRHIDVQYIVRGEERIGWAPLGRMGQGAYDGAKDLLPLSGVGEFLTLRAGDFMILFPGDAHMPGIAAGAPAPVRKAVVKIRLA